MANKNNEYNNIVMYCLSKKIVNKDKLCEEFNLTENEYDILIKMLFNDGVLYIQDSNGSYHANPKYIHPDEKREREKLKQQRRKSSADNRKMLSILLAIVAWTVFITTIIFLSTRSNLLMGILLPIASLVLSFAFYEKIGTVIPLFLMIVLCVFSILLVNNITPLFGEKYERRAMEEEFDRTIQLKLNEQKMYIQQAESALRKILKDPDSAKISNSFKSGTGAVCGNVNAKNSFNAYTGYQRYIYLLSTPFIDDGSESFDKTWNEHCG